MIKNNDRRTFFNLLITYLFLFLIWTLFSFVFTDPNLTLINRQAFIACQNFLWQNILPNTYLRVGTYLTLTGALMINYLYLIKFWPKKIKFFDKKIIITLLPLFLILLISYNALSHDLFNYIFNARILIKYGTNPHRVAALNFPNDPWLRFMHNVHTTAPYGQAWTIISLIPYFFGFNKFLLTYLSFKFFAFLGMLLSYFFLNKLLNKKENKNFKLALLFLNPLILIETLANAHNDWWMMWPVLASFLIAKKFIQEKNKNYFWIILIVLLMFFSVFTKFASLVAIPFLIYYLSKNHLEKLLIFKTKFPEKIKHFIDQYFWDLISISFFLPLLTKRSQCFLTWYLIWPMAFLPLLKSKCWRNNLLIFSFSALLSYVPWILYLPWLNFEHALANVLLYKQVILWSSPLIYNLFLLLNLIIKNVKNKR